MASSSKFQLIDGKLHFERRRSGVLASDPLDGQNRASVEFCTPNRGNAGSPLDHSDFSTSGEVFHRSNGGH
jgi:hypothetical protein